MNAELEDWKNGWHGLRLALTHEEIDKIVRLLQSIQADPEQHFHLSSDYKADGGLGDIEVSLKDASQPDNLFIWGVAQPPGATIPTTTGAKQ